MQVRHLVARANVTGHGQIINPAAVRHGSLRAGRVWALAGPVDPETHLNLDFGDHQLGGCVVVEALVEGAPALAGEDGGPVLALPDPAALTHHGAVDVGARRAAWLAALRERRHAATSPAIAPTRLPKETQSA